MTEFLKGECLLHVTEPCSFPAPPRAPPLVPPLELPVGVGGNHETAAKQAAVFEQANSEIKAASNILVVGGGPVGIETAGEIREEFPDKNVTLVTSKELMPSPTLPFSQRFRDRLLKKLQQMGVTVHTDCGRINFNTEDIDACGFIVGKKTYSWAGAEAEADLCIVAAGARQTPSLYADSGLQGWLDDKGLLMVGVFSSRSVFGMRHELYGCTSTFC